MKRALGGTISEYGLILALTAIVAVASLGFLGDAISDGLGNAGDFSRASDLFALLDGPAGNSHAGGTGNATAAVPDPQASLSGNSSVGDFGNGFSTSTIGNVSTSAEGTEMASNAIKAVAHTGTLPDGTSLSEHFGSDWSKIQGYLNDLAAQGHTMAGYENQTLAKANDDDKVDSNLKKLQSTLSPYKKTYNKLANHLEKNYKGDNSAAIAGLKDLVDNSSGVITYSANSFIQDMARKGDDFKPKKDLEKQAVGTVYQPGDTYTIPVVTTKSANDMETAATP